MTLAATGASEMIISENSDFSGASYEAYYTSKAFTLSSTNGTKTVYVKYKDAAGNESAAVSDTIILDTVVPTVTVTSSETSPTNAVPIPITVTFSESVSGFDVSNLTVGNGSADNFSGSGTTYTADITPTADGTVTVDILADSAVDVAGNGNTAAAQLSIVSDIIAPTGTSISINGGDAYTNSTSVTLTLGATGASEMIISENSDFSGASYEAYSTSKAFTLSSTNGTKTVYVKYKDAAGNESTAVSDTIILDTVVPTVAITSSETSPTNAVPIPITITFSESVTGFDIIDLTVGNCSADNFSGSGTTYTADITPTADGTVSIDILADSAVDVANNGNTAAAQFSIVSDTLAPSGTSISINDGDTYTNSTSVTLTLAATGANEMIISENAEFSGASYEAYGTSKAFTLSSTNGTKTVYVKYKDVAGNESAAVSDTIILDTVVPAVTIASSETSPTNAVPIPITVTFSESVTGFDASDIIVGNGSAGNFSGSGASYTADITPAADGTVTVDISADAAVDAADNGNTAAQLSIISDTLAPTDTSVTINNGRAYTVSRYVTLTLAATGASEMMISEDENFSGASYEAYSDSKSFTLSVGDGTKTVYVKYKDAAGNESTAVSDTIKLDTHDPADTDISINDGDAYTNSASVTLTLTATGASKMIISEDSTFSDVSYEAYAGSKSFTLSTGDGIKTVYVKFKDAAGNESSVISDTIKLDTTAPAVTITTESTDPTDAVPITITITFSESVIGFDLSDLSISGGSADNFSGSGDSYSVDITSDAGGTITVDIAENAAQDTAGNSSIASSRFSIYSDTSGGTEESDENGSGSLGTISGWIVDISGKPMSGILVELHSQPMQTYTDEQGYFEFKRVELGEHTIYVIDDRLNDVDSTKVEFLLGNKSDAVSQEFKRDLSKEGIPIELNSAVEIEMHFTVQKVVILQTSSFDWMWLLIIPAVAVLLLIFLLWRKRRRKDEMKSDS